VSRRKWKLRSVCDAKRNSFCKVQIRLSKSQSESRWVSLSWFDVTPVPPVPISWERTSIFDVVEDTIMEWTMPNANRVCRLWLDSNPKQGRLRGRQVLVLVFLTRLRLRFLVGWYLSKMTTLPPCFRKLTDYQSIIDKATLLWIIIDKTLNWLPFYW
jgi:hypothetical protein